MPIGLTVATPQVAESVKGLSISTFGGNPVAATAAKAVIDLIEEERLMDNAAMLGAYLREKLVELQAKHPIIGDVRGMGLLQAIELVRDRATKEPAAEETLAILEATRRNGLLVGKGGLYGNVIRISPPLNISRDDVDAFAEALDRSLGEASAGRERVPMFNYDRTFDSVNDCVAYLTGHFAGKTCEVVKAGAPCVDDAHPPETVLRYLYRGECGDYSTTLPSIDRLDEQDLDVEDRKQIIELGDRIVKHLADSEIGFGLAEHDARGLVQHLGLPTEYIDFTQCVDVAAAFAAYSERDELPDRGCICVLDVQPVKIGGPIHLAKLHPRPFLERANKQRGFGVYHQDFRDLKSPEAIAAFNAKWFDFPIRKADRDRCAGMYQQLLDPRSDPTAGLLRWLVNMYIADLGKLRRRAAEFCAARIPMAPLVGRARPPWQPEGFPQDLEFVLPSDFGFEWNEADARDYSLHLWSEEFPEALPRDFMHQVQVRNDGIFVFPATHHPLPTHS